MVRRPRPLFFSSQARPLCGFIRWGQATPLRERAQIVQLAAQGYSCTAISRMAFVGRHRKTIAAILRRATQNGTLLPRPSGGAANSPPKLDAVAMLYLQARPGAPAAPPLRADSQRRADAA